MELVVLLHGFARSSRSMNAISEVFANNDFKVLLIDYPTKKYSIDYLSEHYLLPEIITISPMFDKIHFVGHSMGAIIARYFVANNQLDNLGKIVQITPPNQGSQYVDFANKYSLLKYLLGPAILQLGTNSKFLLDLPKPDYDIGVINGNVNPNPFARLFLPENNDGIISYHSCQLEGMSDFISLPFDHNSILKSPEVAQQALNFITKGKFCNFTRLDTL